MPNTIEHIVGNINQYGRPMVNQAKSSLKKIQRESNRFRDSDMMNPTCDTLKNILVYTNWVLLVVLLTMLIGIFSNFPAGLMLFLTLVAVVMITYAAFINMRWPDMVECARIKMLKEDQAIQKQVY